MRLTICNDGIVRCVVLVLSARVQCPSTVLMTPPFPVFPVPPGYRWRDYSAMAVIMVGVAFGLQHLYKVRSPRDR